MSESILVERVDGVCRVTINRPERRNALDPASRDRLLEVLAEARADSAVRALLLTGAGGAFCTGADMTPGPSAPPPPQDGGEAPRGIDLRAASEMMRTGAQRLVRTLFDLDKPTVAAVAGPAAGLGAHLALACDLVVMAEDARLIEVFMRRGLVVDAMGAWLLPRLVGLGRAKQLAFFAEDVRGPQALEWGLAQRVVPADQLDAEAMEWATRLAKGPTRALGLTKQLINRALESSIEQSLNDEAWAVALNTQSSDMKEGMIAFLQRRPPEFAGR
jgi:2-(1,2-epoxy-1,2-dihydrophenyl)acetyl-CoA isomerase